MYVFELRILVARLRAVAVMAIADVLVIPEP